MKITKTVHADGGTETITVTARKVNAGFYVISEGGTRVGSVTRAGSVSWRASVTTPGKVDRAVAHVRGMRAAVVALAVHVGKARIKTHSA